MKDKPTKLPRRPAELVDPYARRYWDRHAAALWEAGVLTPRDVESFVILCQVFGRLQALSALPVDPANFRAATQHNNLLKQYQQYARSFGLIGPQRRATAPEKEESIADIIRAARLSD
jgi:hypothetical protein